MPTSDPEAARAAVCDQFLRQLLEAAPHSMVLVPSADGNITMDYINDRSRFINVRTLLDALTADRGQPLNRCPAVLPGSNPPRQCRKQRHMTVDPGQDFRMGDLTARRNLAGEGELSHITDPIEGDIIVWREDPNAT